MFRFAATYTSKENANDEEPLVDLSSVPSLEAHRMRDGNLHPIQVHDQGLVMFDLIKNLFSEPIFIPF